MRDLHSSPWVNLFSTPPQWCPGRCWKWCYNPRPPALVWPPGHWQQRRPPNCTGRSPRDRFHRWRSSGPRKSPPKKNRCPICSGFLEKISQIIDKPQIQAFRCAAGTAFSKHEASTLGIMKLRHRRNLNSNPLIKYNAGCRLRNLADLISNELKAACHYISQHSAL